jgi:hypothetical protein
MTSQDLTDAVGHINRKACPNRPTDVKLVKELLNSHAKRFGLTTLLTPSDATVGPKTIKAIEDFQRIVMKKGPPYGRVLPIRLGGKTFMALQAKPNATPILSQWSGASETWSEQKKLESMTPTLRPKVQSVLVALRKRGFQPKIFYGWRSVAVQQELYKKGNSKVKFSFHNAQKPDGTPNAYAADIIDSRYAWSPQAETSGFWKALGEEAKKAGLYWGGDWSSFRDWAHVQLLANSQLQQVKKESGF